MSGMLGGYGKPGRMRLIAFKATDAAFDAADVDDVETMGQIWVKGIPIVLQYGY